MKESDIQVESKQKGWGGVALIAILATIESLTRISEIWRRLDFNGRFGAISLVGCLVLFPLTLTIKRRSGKEIETRWLVMMTYMLVLVASSLFGR
jgi:hypothetical protein